MRKNVERTQLAENAPPGWYQAETDPPGTERYWDGGGWSDETRSAMAPPPSGTPSAPAPAGVKMTPHGRELASAWSRIGARLIDGVILFIVLGLLFGFDINSPNRDVTTTDLLLSAVLGGAYEILFTALRSATPGKMALGLEIVRQNDGGSPLGFGPAGMRWLPNVVSVVSVNLSGLVGLASLVLLFVDKYRRTVFDFVGQTYVVRKSR